MELNYKAPVFEASAFTCPHCGIYASQQWQILNATAKPDLRLSQCSACKADMVWRSGQPIYPLNSQLPPPHSLLPVSAYPYYHLARNVALQSPSAGCAYLRKALDVMLKQMTKPDLNSHLAIVNLIERELGSRAFWEAFIKVNIYGYNLKEPLVIYESDDEAMLNLLFHLTNRLVEEVVANPLALADFFAKLSNQKEENKPIVDSDFFTRP